MPHRRDLVLAVVLLAAAPAFAQDAGTMRDHGSMNHGAAATAPAPGNTAAARAYSEAVAKMHAAMAVVPTGDPDRDFLVGMIAHHEGAIAMAEVELAHGTNADARRMAETIVAAQRGEIAQMRRMLDALPPVPKS